MAVTDSKRKGRVYIMTLFPDSCMVMWSYVTAVLRVHHCACVELELGIKELELLCSVWFVLLNNFKQR